MGLRILFKKYILDVVANDENLFENSVFGHFLK